MNWFTGIATFMILWWLSLFIVLPIGVRGQAEDNDIAHGTEPGAPTRPDMLKKVIWTTVMAAIFFLLVVLIVESGWLTWARLADWFAMQKPTER